MTNSSSLPRRLRIGMMIGLALVVLLGVVLYQSWPVTLQQQLARARTSNGSPVQTLAMVQSLIQSAHGDFPEAQLYECQLLLRLNKADLARIRFAEIQHPEMCDFEELCKLAEQAQGIGDSALAAQVLSSVENIVLKHPLRLKLLIYALYTKQNSGDEPEGRILHLCEQYAKLAPEDAFPWLVSSSLYHERGVPNLAVQSYREALQRQLLPEEAYRVRVQLVQLELLLGELPQAREHCDALLQATHDPASLRMVKAMHAELLQREGRSAKAIQILDELLATNPEWTKARALRGRCRFEQGDLTGAINDLSEAVRQNDFDQQSHYVLAQAYQKQKDEQRATTHWDRSRELNQIKAQILTLENQLRNDLYNRDLKLQLAKLNEQIGDNEKAAAWRRGANQRLPLQPR